ncbi:uncharacterized protein PV09_04683 [Verruconis gallopava]|uniref:Uncharacterized protein n=1 Tax=Verruconis gallopava TaxID=253628 RepID=A0A0D1YUR3_9PEZI|nr:uncharacterized protein PV09_04683 [Verruconis gallopava]KIW04407.1 hypothetical protein PV09_04683 [Verruconis gallopava]
MEPIERHTSYARGGAGNMRRKSEQAAALQELATSGPDVRRRDSILSSGSSRRGSIVDALTAPFRRMSSSKE